MIADSTFPGLGQISDADRLPNGNTLVGSRKHVIEFDARGKELWRRAVRYAGEVTATDRQS